MSMNSSDKQSAFDGLQKIIVCSFYKVFEFAVEWISAIWNKA